MAIGDAHADKPCGQKVTAFAHILLSMITVTNHLNFRGTAREALGFYASVFGGGEPTIVTFADAHSVGDPAEADQVMWGQVESDRGFRIMAFDVPSARPYDAGQDAYYVSVRGDDEDEVRGYWERLSEGATVRQPLGPAGWSALYGMLEDRFGVVWVLDVAAAQPAG
jgi:PhnB protein